MTTRNLTQDAGTCPVQGLLKLLSGKWKPEIFRLAVEAPLRFSGLLRQIHGSNRQTLSLALKELEEIGLLEKVVIKPKPLHIEYHLTEKGRALVPVFLQLETIL
ncbi:winged helix-turn-helix transcriptional regulator [Niabella drilacis]|uniref:Transcriptional regulator, HxlR family n=1 Tax=Niabella drilacis (strain DSM 25811 / CCM 8410 / CCUG 62505 / LMG 26954 / E90) TaxID=1285928 RepID=A0A1G6L2G9_NIADE|nr:helix-turn-helix domain-containing protein [Niabella drilacis]SDC37321.1 transcriptional regulator, HxlR family [Niabella drilacis]